MADLTVTLIQTAIHWEDIEANLQMLDQKIDSIQEKTELVILPEMFTTGFSMHPEKLAEEMNGRAIQWMKKKAAEKKMIITGSLMVYESREKRYFNRLLWVLPTGQSAFYDKRHLFAYAGEDKKYAPGDKKLIGQVKGWKIYPVICYDLRFPVWLRQPVEPENRYDLLVCVANWPASRSVAWSTLLQARAIENQCYVAGVNRTGTDGNGISYAGDSCIVDPVGTMLITRGSEESIFTYTLQKENIEKTRDQFPFLNDADHFSISGP